MAFQLSGEHVESYYHHGFTVFRGIVPPALVKDLRKALEPGKAIAREKSGASAQRLQPLGQYEDRLDLDPVRAYIELPELVDAIHAVLSPEHKHCGIGRLGCFYEPAALSYCTQWHRDITFATAAMESEEQWEALNRDPRYFTQVNFALYTDVSTWYVPGSAGRRNVAGEVEAADDYPTLEGEDEVVRERRCLSYCQGMPRGVQLVLEPGDYALYQPNGWHIGSYAPYRKRITLHEGWWAPETFEWYRTWGERQAKMAAKNDPPDAPDAPAKTEAYT